MIYGLYYRGVQYYAVISYESTQAFERVAVSKRFLVVGGYVFLSLSMYRSWDSLLVRAPESRSKGCEFESRQERRKNFVLQS